MKVEFSPEEKEQLLVELRPLSNKMAKEIVEIANVHPIGNSGAIAGTIASLVLQSILTSIAVKLFEPGDNEGQDWLTENYDNALMDTLKLWSKPELKIHFSKKNIRH